MTLRNESQPAGRHWSLRRADQADAEFPREMLRPPRSLAEPMFTNIRRWTVMKKGGHFAAMEQPQALAEDVRAFYRALRERL